MSDEIELARHLSRLVSSGFGEVPQAYRLNIRAYDTDGRQIMHEPFVVPVETTAERLPWWARADA